MAARVMICQKVGLRVGSGQDDIWVSATIANEMLDQPNKSKTHNFPHSATSFIGREKELADIERQLADPDCRLLTLVGPGGMGKTRLAVQSGYSTSQFEDGIYFVNLQPILDAALLPTILAQELGLSLSGAESPADAVRSFLGKKKVLIILDNFEGILDASPLVATFLVKNTAKFLVTSRESLNIREEWVYPIGGTTFPNDGEQMKQAADYDAIRLFTDRARQAQPDFDLARESAAVAEISRLVDGSPLALELAAHWTRALGCEEIVQEIRRNLSFLSTHMRNVPKRHRSLEAIFTQTWDGLSADERAVFMRLTMFRGGFHADAAFAVTKATLVMLVSLQDKGLIRREANQTGRYQIHELLRQFGSEKLAQSGQELAETEMRHGLYYSHFLAQRLEDLLGNEQAVRMNEIQAEYENIRLAWKHLVAKRAVEQTKQMLMPLLSFFWYRSRYQEGREFFNQALSFATELPENRDRWAMIAIAKANLALFLMALGELDASSDAAAAAWDIYDRYDLALPFGMDSDPRLTLANNMRLLGKFDLAKSFARDALAYNQTHHNARNVQEAMRMLAEAQLAEGDLVASAENAAMSLSLASTANDLSGAAYARETLGTIAYYNNQLDRASEHFSISLKLWQQLQHPIGQADMLQRLGDVALEQEDEAQAETYLEQSLALFERQHVIGGIFGSLVRLGQLVVNQAQYEAARQYLLRAITIAKTFPNQHGEQILRLLLGSAELLSQNGQVLEAITILANVLTHPQLQNVHDSRARQLLDLLAEQIERSQFQTASATGMSRSSAQQLDCLRALLADETLITNSGVPSRPEQPLMDPLTNRELEVLALIAQGMTNREIADHLIIARGTAKYYTSVIYSKLQVSNRTQAVAHARELGIL